MCFNWLRKESFPEGCSGCADLGCNVANKIIPMNKTAIKNIVILNSLVFGFRYSVDPHSWHGGSANDFLPHFLQMFFTRPIIYRYQFKFYTTESTFITFLPSFPNLGRYILMDSTTNKRCDTINSNMACCHWQVNYLTLGTPLGSDWFLYYVDFHYKWYCIIGSHSSPGSEQ